MSKPHTIGELFNHPDAQIVHDEGAIEVPERFAEAAGRTTLHVLPLVEMQAQTFTPHEGAVQPASWIAAQDGVLDGRLPKALRTIASRSDNPNEEQKNRAALRAVRSRNASDFDTALITGFWGHGGIDVIGVDPSPKDPEAGLRREIRDLLDGLYIDERLPYDTLYEQQTAVASAAGQALERRDVYVARRLMDIIVDKAADGEHSHGLFPISPVGTGVVYLLNGYGLPFDNMTPSPSGFVTEDDTPHPMEEWERGDTAEEHDDGGAQMRRDKYGMIAMQDVMVDPTTHMNLKARLGFDISEDDFAAHITHLMVLPLVMTDLEDRDKTASYQDLMEVYATACRSLGADKVRDLYSQLATMDTERRMRSLFAEAVRDQIP